ncbi:alpha/beta hydrolase family protein [Actinomycetospora sp. NBC_00405]|uniref:alpha/beta hydrolase family protein n=1 Tax=Actinomycetospora sp. NBC_00405 TaxID=2975952 RepID=UPI002E1B5940
MARGRSNTVFSAGFFADEGWDFAVRIALGQCASGGADAGEVLATVARIHGGKSWTPEWSSRAEQLGGTAEQRAQRGDERGAAAAFLRAAGYGALALDGLTGDEDSERLTAAFRAHRASWERFVDCSAGRHERVAVPYEDTTLPGWLLRPDASGRARPTLVMTNGSDGPVTSLWGSGAAAALERGWNAFVYDGPGQQSLLFERGVGFRPDWEAVLTPVVDALVARDDVDADRLTGYGISQAGYWLPRALAFEHRLVAAVADPGVVDVSTAWTERLPASMVTMLEQGDREKFNRNMRLPLLMPSVARTLRSRARPFRCDDWFDTFTEARRYRLTPELADAICTPLMVTDPEDEQFWPGQAQQLADLVPGSHHVRFLAAEGANIHCQPMARLLTHERMFAWLDEQLATSGS